MLKKLFTELLRWSLRLHGFFHLAHIIQDIYAPGGSNWTGVFMSLYMMSVEILASFFIPKEHVHFKPIKSDVHEKCED